MGELELPEKWFCAGSHPAEYEMGIDPDAHFQSMRVACLKCTVDSPGGFGTLMQSCSARSFHGKRIRYTANMRVEGVRGNGAWAGAWMRVDPQHPYSGSMAFDNMQDRALKGTTNWAPYSIVLDVPEEAKAVAYGVLLSGGGKVWLADLKIEVVDSDTPTTGLPSGELEAPANLSFAE